MLNRIVLAATLLALAGCMLPRDHWFKAEGLVLRDACDGRGAVPAANATVTVLRPADSGGPARTGASGRFHFQVWAPPVVKEMTFELEVTSPGCRPLRQQVAASGVLEPSTTSANLTLVCECSSPSP